MDKHLLIVEDDELVRSLLAASMQNEGFKVSPAANGKEMLACIDSESIDLLLLDLGLSDEDGLVLARQVRTRAEFNLLAARVRKKIEKDSKTPEIITTVVGCGYRFSA